MDLDRLTSILALMREHGLSELEIEQDGLHLRARKDLGVQGAWRPAAADPASPSTTRGPVAPAVPMTAPPDADAGLLVVKSPMVGTFYRSSEPSAPVFVEVGASVRKGQVLCIIEAMKLMNEIDSEYDGEVVGIYAVNGQPVQYGERLFAIRPQ